MFYLVIIIVLLLALGFLLLYKTGAIDHFSSFQDPYLDTLKAKLAVVFPELDLFKLRGSTKSFTMFKEEMYVCLFDKHNKYYEENTLIYVILHELAHTLCSVEDTREEHSPEFHRIFNDLLERAEMAGLYDGKPIQKGYCGYS